MPRSQWLRPPRQMLLLFLAVTVAPAAALGYLSWRLLEQDRALESQRIQERLEHAADLIVVALERRLSDLADQLPYLVPKAEDALVVSFPPQEIEVHPAGRLLYYPAIPETKESPEAVFERAEALEFQRQDYAGAIAVFLPLTAAADPQMRAAKDKRFKLTSHCFLCGPPCRNPLDAAADKMGYANRGACAPPTQDSTSKLGVLDPYFDAPAPYCNARPVPLPPGHW